jgi:signal transduction histidine kinase
MRERAKAINAELTVASQAGHGTEIAIYWVNTMEQQTL